MPIACEEMGLEETGLEVTGLKPHLQVVLQFYCSVLGQCRLHKQWGCCLPVQHAWAAHILYNSVSARTRAGHCRLQNSLDAACSHRLPAV